MSATNDADATKSNATAGTEATDSDGSRYDRAVEQESTPQVAMDQRVNNRTLSPSAPAFKEFMLEGWGDEDKPIEPLESSAYTPARIKALGAKFPGQRLVIPAGTLKTRNNDCDYRFRPDSAFAYYTGLGEDFEPNAVLVLDPVDPDGPEAKTGLTHTPTLFVHPRADHTTEDYYRSAAYGEYWIGARPGLRELAQMTGIPTRDVAELEDALSKDVGAEAGAVRVRVIDHVDPQVTAIVEEVRQANGFKDPDANRDGDDGLLEAASTQRMVKDPYEVRELTKAVEATKAGFDRMLAALPAAVGRPRSERILEGRFNANAREMGNDEGYGSIVASGPHAATLHWMSNNGTIRDGELLLIDAGVETNSLYTADITRTFPVGGRFTPLQRRLYDAVLEAQYAGFEAAKPGRTYSDIHHAVMRVLAEHPHEWGILPVSVEESLSPEGQQHRRWHACGCAHHLGLDVHDCAQARFEDYQEAPIRPGYVFTIEPGLYFKENDLLVPPEYRGIGLRIEDDVLMTEDGPKWLSKPLIPSAPDDVEAWMAAQAARTE